MRRNVPKVLVVVTDGRSQDDVKKSAEKLQHSGANVIRSCSFMVWFLLNIVFTPHTKLPQPRFVAYLINSFNCFREETVMWLLKVCQWYLFVSFTYRLQCLCCRSGWRGHDRVENNRQQTQREACVCGGWLWRICQDPGQPDHIHLWNSHFQ